jgi:hypothetical protein
MRLALSHSLPFVALAILAVLPAYAQEQPIFSGKWIEIEPSPDAGAVLTVVQNDHSIRIEPGSSLGPRSRTYGVGTVGGIVGGTTGGSTGSLQWRWKDGRLVITQDQMIFELGAMTLQSSREEVWSLDSDGRLVVVITEQKADATPTTKRFVYRRTGS